MHIDFESLLKSYNDELLTKLRGFNEEHDYLQYWVPDSNKTTSLLNLVDALYEINKLNFSITVQKEDDELINKLKNISKKIGNIKINKEEKSYKIDFLLNELKYKVYRAGITRKKNNKPIKTQKLSNIKELTEKKENYNILHSYGKNLKNYKLKKNKQNYINDENVFSEYINNKNKLFIKMEKKNNSIIETWHDFKKKNKESILVDKFCDIISNKNIQEAAEHGIIYLEHEIRPKEITKKIRGIIFPKKAGNLFFDLNKCIRKIYKKTKIKYNFQDKINKDYFGLLKDWKKLSYDQKMEKLNQVLSEKIIPSLKLNKDDIIVHKVEFDSRVIIKISDKLEEKNRKEMNYMIKIENFFKYFVDKRLELFTTEKKDENKLRHLNSPQKI